MSRAFGPVVVVSTSGHAVESVHCNWCIFREWRDGSHACSYMDRRFPKPIPNPSDTPDWCEMKAGAIRDSLDMAMGVKHRVWRWSGRKSDDPRLIFEGIPSEARRQFRLTARDAKRGTVSLFDEEGNPVAVWPSPNEGEDFA